MPSGRPAGSSRTASVGIATMTTFDRSLTGDWSPVPVAAAVARADKESDGLAQSPAGDPSSAPTGSDRRTSSARMRAAGGPPQSGPYQNSMTDEQYHLPLMSRHMPRVYGTEPSQPGGITSGQRPAPSRFEKSTCTPAAEMSTSVIDVVIGQVARSKGEFRIVELVRSNAGGGGGAGVGSGAGGAGGSGGGGAGVEDLRCSVWVPRTGPKQVVTRHTGTSARRRSAWRLPTPRGRNWPLTLPVPSPSGPPSSGS